MSKSGSGIEVENDPTADRGTRVKARLLSSPWHIQSFVTCLSAPARSNSRKIILPWLQGLPGQRTATLSDEAIAENIVYIPKLNCACEDGNRHDKRVETASSAK